MYTCTYIVAKYICVPLQVVACLGLLKVEGKMKDSRSMGTVAGHFTVDPNKLEHGWRMIHAGCHSFFGMGLEDCHVPSSSRMLPVFFNAVCWLQTLCRLGSHWREPSGGAMEGGVFIRKLGSLTESLASPYLWVPRFMGPPLGSPKASWEPWRTLPVAGHSAAF